MPHFPLEAVCLVTGFPTKSSYNRHAIVTFVGALFFTSFHTLFAQTLTSQVVTTQTVVRSIERERWVINETTKFIDKETGKQITYQDYRQLMKNAPNGYYLEPIINEYGVADAYTVRQTTAEERETHRFIDRNTTLRPKVGDAMPEFVMKGLNDTTYRLSTLKGRIVVLSFWLGFSPPFLNPTQLTSFANALRPFQTENGPITIGVVRDSKEAMRSLMASQPLPFMPIPNAYTFGQRYNITHWPSLFVIDKTGTVVAYLEGQGMFEQLTKVLEQASR